MIIDEKKEKEGETESKKHRRTHPFMSIDQLVIARRMDSDEHQTNA